MKSWKMRLAAVVPIIAFGALLPGAACDDAADTIKDTQGALCCSEFDVGGDMSAVDWEVSGAAEARFSAFMQATGDLSGAATAVVNEVSAACQAIALDLGADEKAVTETDPAKRASKWCELAVGKIRTEITAKGTVTIVAQPPSCSFSASAQANCEASCTANAQCQAELGDVKARCEAGQLSGKCSAQCSGTCEGSADLAVTCNGACSGTCNGTCDGNQSSAACSGVCNGTCTGSCKVAAGANVTCEGDCTGGCSVDVKAPKCKAQLTPPKAECQADAQCSGSCKASASAKAECRPGSISITATGNIDAQALASLKLNLPRILAVFQVRGQMLLGNAQAVASAAGSLKGDGGSLSVKAVACLVPATLAITSAVSNIDASVKASTSVAGSLNIGK